MGSIPIDTSTTERKTMRRIFIIRKDLHLKPGKLAAMIGHCCEAYWTNLLKGSIVKDNEFATLPCIDTNPSTGKPGPALYRHPKLYNLSVKAFNEGKQFFVVEHENARKTFTITIEISKDIWNNYVNDIFTKTICECRNKNQLLKAETIALELGLNEGKDYGFINDKCLTDLTPENEDGTCTVGMWFKPLDDEIAHKISKKFPLYRDD